jgi:hypothetical protein
VLAKLWARTKVDHLMHESGSKAEITQLGLAYKLMTPYTSFVAVEDKIVNEGGQSRRVEVPVEMPEGVSHDGVFGEAKIAGLSGAIAHRAMMAPMAAPPPFLPRSEQASIHRLVQEASADYRSKLHPSLAGLTGTRKVDVQVWVTDRSAANLAALKQLGFEIVSVATAQAKLCVGRIEADKLADLARLGFVTYVSPAR